MAPPADHGKMKSLDKNLLVALYKIYFPSKKLGRGEGDFNAGRFTYQMMFEGVFPGLRLRTPNKSFGFEELANVEFPQDKDVEDLIYRYFRSRIFGKLYFGAGFGQLSLITGFHHLLITYVLLKENSKIVALSRGASVPSYLDVVVAVRTLEKRLGETSVGGYAARYWSCFCSVQLACAVFWPTPSPTYCLKMLIASHFQRFCLQLFRRSLYMEKGAAETFLKSANCFVGGRFRPGCGKKMYSRLHLAG